MQRGLHSVLFSRNLFFFADSVASVFSCFSPSIELELGLSGHPDTPFLKHKIKLISVNKILSFSKLH